MTQEPFNALAPDPSAFSQGHCARKALLEKTEVAGVVEVGHE
jgi:hypothetical protein